MTGQRPLYLAIFFATMLVAGAVAANAQEFQGGLGFAMGLPQGPFDDTVDNTGYGPSLSFGYSFGSIPVTVGVEGSFLIYGVESRREHFNPNIPEVDVSVRTTNSITNAMLVTRIGPNSGMIRPYIDAGIGINYLATVSSVDGDDGGENSTIASTTNHRDLVLAYGVGAGVKIEVFRNDVPDTAETGGRPLRSVFIDVRGRYMSSEEGEYLVSGAIQRVGSQIFVTPSYSRIDMVALYAGVGIAF